MGGTATKNMRPTGRGGARSGRPRRESAGEVEERILAAASKVFLERGFDGASIEEIAVEARAGKPTIYARFPGKEALFSAVVAGKVHHSARFDCPAAVGFSSEERLKTLAVALLHKALGSEAVGLVRVAVAESRRFPELASRVGRMARDRGNETLAGILGELAKSDEMGALPAFAPDRLAATARRFIDVVVMPIATRALFGEDVKTLNAEIGPHVADSVAFFLAACRAGGGAKPSVASPAPELRCEASAKRESDPKILE
jgi:AcrR family transcriptional regulator